MISEFKVISVMNEAMLKTLKDKNLNYTENLKIEEMLKDESLFFKINKEEAYRILTTIGVKNEQLDSAYKKLISTDYFYDLVNRGIINPNDESLIIKYNIYDYDDLFKGRNKSNK